MWEVENHQSPFCEYCEWTETMETKEMKKEAEATQTALGAERKIRKLT